ncbi:MKP2_12 [Blepharisma stoltei]|uniref:Dual specificity protein phosphatase 1 n=1 Tax=Blepharisma stoltei TaxID=1481888 RepID=A0AAU9K0I2_9CILI|nr:unnamed protein product [Blepharisma stoltei]
MESAADPEIKNLEEPLPGVPNDEKMMKLMVQIRMILALKYAKTDNQPSEVLENLYIGSVGAAMCKKNLKDLGITHILIVADQLAPAFPEEFIYKQINILDSPDSNIIDTFTDAFQFIDQGRAQGKVLVHCFAGKSRSGTICIGYVMKERNCSLLDAFRYVREKRDAVLPNTGFMNQLKRYESVLNPN